MSYTEITSFEAACEALGYSTAVPEVSNIADKHQQATVSIYKLFVVTEAVNEGEEIRWNDLTQKKYCPLWDMSSGSGVSFYASLFVVGSSYVGSRLSVLDPDKSDFLAENFSDLYDDLMVIRK